MCWQSLSLLLSSSRRSEWRPALAFLRLGGVENFFEFDQLEQVAMVLVSSGRFLGGDETVYRENVDGQSKHGSFHRLSQDLIVVADAAHFAQQVDVSAVGDEKKVHPIRKGR